MEREEVERILKDLYNLDNVCRATELLGNVGNHVVKKSTYLCAVSTKNENPKSTLSQITKGESGVGKSSGAKSVLDLIPKETAIIRSRITPAALDHLATGSLDRKVLFIEEVGGNQSGYSLKLAISESELVLDTVTKRDGEHMTQTKRVSAKNMSFITTTTSQRIDNELESRCLILYSDTSKNHLERVREQIFNGNAKPHPDSERIKQTFQEAFKALKPFHVSIPFSKELLRRLPTLPNQFRMLTQIRALIEAHAILQQDRREKEDGVLIAIFEDYLAIKDIIEAALTPPSPDRSRLETAFGDKWFDWQSLAGLFGCEKSTAFYHIDRFKKTGLISEVNHKYRLNRIILPEVLEESESPNVYESKESDKSNESEESEDSKESNESNQSEKSEHSQDSEQSDESEQSQESNESETIDIEDSLNNENPETPYTQKPLDSSDSLDSDSPPSPASKMQELSKLLEKLKGIGGEYPYDT